MMRVRIGVDCRFDGVPRRFDVIDRNIFRNIFANTLSADAVGFDGLRLRRFPRRLACCAFEPPALPPSLDVDRRRLNGHQPRPVEFQIGVLRFDRLSDLFRERLASELDLRRCPEPEQNPGTRLLRAIRRWLEEVVRLVAALIARDLQVRHGGAAFRYFLFWARAGFFVLTFGFGALRGGGAVRAGFLRLRAAAGLEAIATGCFAAGTSRFRCTSVKRT